VDDERELLLVACHDLCAPLNAIYMQAQRMRLDLAAGKAELAALGGFLDRLEALTLNATRLAKDVLTTEGFAADGGGPVCELDLDEVLATAVSFHAESLERARCAVVVTRDGDLAGLRGRWDRSVLESVFSNLLQNASRYAAGSPVTIHFSPGPDAIVVRVSDGGPGLLPRDPASAHGHAGHAGRGLGMWIVRRAVARLGGQLSLRNGDDHGLTVEIALPRA
jgi:signal transduction histidine kinase